MKNFILILLSSIIWASSFSQTKYAIVVAVGDYPLDENGNTVWNDLKSMKDVELLKTMFQEQNFEDQNCTYLLEVQATPENLDKAFDKLLSQIKEGDIVYFHYSGHGQQVADIKPKKRKGIKYKSRVNPSEVPKIQLD